MSVYTLAGEGDDSEGSKEGEIEDEADSDEEASGNEPHVNKTTAAAAASKTRSAKAAAAALGSEDEVVEGSSEEDEDASSEEAATSEDGSSPEASDADTGDEGKDASEEEESDDDVDTPASAQQQLQQQDRLQSNAQATSSHQPAVKGTADDADDIPFTIQAPASYQAYSKLVHGRSASQLQTIVQRIRACNAIALATDNRRKLQVSTCLNALWSHLWVDLLSL